MKWYSGTGEPPDRAAEDLPISLLERHSDPSGYLAEQGLVDAVNVALRLGQPLLLTGQPGTGKTQLAYSLAWELGLPLEKFETKSTSVARDLFYTYDALGRFHAAQTAGESPNPLDYIRFNALGLAILSANVPAAVKHLLRDEVHDEPGRTVVLIDEIDKAPRDFPNDLLNEIEGLYFRIPELRNETVTATPEMRPVLVLTSNSEKNLPEAFLRRCIFYDIRFPGRDRLERIVHARLGEAIADDRGLLNDALQLFDRLREPGAGLLKRPSTSELLAWLQYLVSDGAHAWDEGIIEPALAALVKTREDRKRAHSLIEEWLNSRG